MTAEPHPQLTAFAQELFSGLYEELCRPDDRMRAMEARIQEAFQADEACQRIAQIEGIGPVIATAIVAAIANGKAFRNGRQLSAWLGLVPRQYSSGDKQRLLGISKRGDPYVRMLLITVPARRCIGPFTKWTPAIAGLPKNRRNSEL